MKKSIEEAIREIHFRVDEDDCARCNEDAQIWPCPSIVATYNDDISAIREIADFIEEMADNEDYRASKLKGSEQDSAHARGQSLWIVRNYIWDKYIINWDGF